jgi:hypothetical protein
LETSHKILKLEIFYKILKLESWVLNLGISQLDQTIRANMSTTIEEPTTIEERQSGGRFLAIPGLFGCSMDQIYLAALATPVPEACEAAAALICEGRLIRSTGSRELRKRAGKAPYPEACLLLARTMENLRLSSKTGQEAVAEWLVDLSLGAAPEDKLRAASIILGLPMIWARPEQWRAVTKPWTIGDYQMTGGFRANHRLMRSILEDKSQHSVDRLRAQFCAQPSVLTRYRLPAWIKDNILVIVTDPEPEGRLAAWSRLLESSPRNLYKFLHALARCSVSLALPIVEEAVRRDRALLRTAWGLRMLPKVLEKERRSDEYYETMESDCYAQPTSDVSDASDPEDEYLGGPRLACFLNN